MSIIDIPEAYSRLAVALFVILVLQTVFQILEIHGKGGILACVDSREVEDLRERYDEPRVILTLYSRVMSLRVVGIALLAALVLLFYLLSTEVPMDDLSRAIFYFSACAVVMGAAFVAAVGLYKMLAAIH